MVVVVVVAPSDAFDRLNHLLGDKFMPTTKSLIIGAHPDDIEVLMGHFAAANPCNHAFVATRGERGRNRLDDEGFCPSRA